MASTDADHTRLLVSIEATQRRFEKQMAAVAKAAGDSAKGVEDNFKRANDNVAAGFGGQARRVEGSLKAQSAAVSNLSFQLNDMATSLLSGASPFTVMVQQGSQVAQVFNGTGGGVVGALRTLGGALAQVANPISLASFAFVGLTGAAVQYFMTLKSEAPDTSKLLSDHAEVIRSFNAAYGIAEDGAKRYTDAVRELESQKLADSFEGLVDQSKAAADEIASNISGRSASEFGGLTQTIDDFRRALSLLDAGNFRDVAIEMQKIESNKQLPDNVRELAKEIRQAALASVPLQDAIEETNEKLKVLRLSAEEGKAAFQTLTAMAVGLGPAGSGAIGAIADKFKNDLLPMISQGIDKIAEMAKNYSELQSHVNKNRLGELAPLYSGGGRFLNEGEVGAAWANEDEMKRVANSAAAQMIKQLEGFQPSGKWDVNAYRAGYGSDTTTRANGEVVKVTEGMIVTLDEAERDLARRLVEFQTGIRNAIGEDTWRSLNEAQQSALTSIAYNYGSLPRRIVDAIQSGGGPEVVAKAIADLGSDNAGVNKSRRRNEAQSYLSGTGYSMSEAGLGNSSKRSPSEIFQGDLSKVQERIDLLTAEYQAQASLNPAVNDYGFALEKARIQQQLLADAQRAGVEVTPELKGQIETLSTAYAKASAAGDELKASQERARDAAQEFSSVGKDLVGGFISDLRAGKSAAEAFGNVLSKLADKFIDAGLDGLFGGGQGSGLFGSLFGGLLGGGKPVFPGAPGGLYAKGGIANQPSIFGEAGAEAAVPLPDGRRIPVVLKGPKNPGPSRSGRPLYQNIRGGDLIIQGDVRDTATVDDIERRIRANNKSIAYAQSNAWRNET